MLEMVPICRPCHTAIHNGEESKLMRLDVAGALYHTYLLRIGDT